MSDVDDERDLQDMVRGLVVEDVSDSSFDEPKKPAKKAPRLTKKGLVDGRQKRNPETARLALAEKRKATKKPTKAEIEAQRQAEYKQSLDDMRAQTQEMARLLAKDQKGKGHKIAMKENTKAELEDDNEVEPEEEPKKEPEKAVRKSKPKAEPTPQEVKVKAVRNRILMAFD